MKNHIKYQQINLQNSKISQRYNQRYLKHQQKHHNSRAVQLQAGKRRHTFIYLNDYFDKS